MIGTTLSHFKITAKLGEGGMGEVYQATDTKLDREVAIKVLPEEFTRSPERLARFRREAKLLASLSHPNIAGIYGLEESGDSQFLTLELVEGENLAERLERGRIEVDDALELGRQMASGLEAAHDRGIVHRDFKPANVMVTPDGQAKILDFGLAKARDTSIQPTDLSQAPTLTAPMTQAGAILGTVGYMSPEQARGEETDRRTDIWAFGVVFWEMLTGKRLFRGKTASDVLAAVLGGVVDWDLLPVGTPDSVRWILHRCLTADVTQRWRDMGDVRIEIERCQEGGEHYPVSSDAASRQPAKSAPARLLWLLVGVLVIALALVGVQGLRWSDEVHPILRLEIDLSSVGALAQRGGPSMTLSPDGSKLALVAGDPPNTKLYIRSLDSLEAILLPGTEGVLNPFFSPDGQEIGFFAQGKLKRISVSSPRAQTICTAAFGLGGSWGSDGTIVFATA
ncbi:MAG: protein kinase, partial [Thermoanaerobaculia bacterium]